MRSIGFLIFWAWPALFADSPLPTPVNLLPLETELRVLDQTTGNPLVAECLVQYGPSSREIKQIVAHTDLEGYCRIRVPESGPEYVKLLVRKSTFARYVRVWEHTTQPNRFPEKLTVEMRPGSTIGGVLQDENGKPMPGITLELVANDNEIPSIQYRDPDSIASLRDMVTTDAHGGWKSEGMPALITSLSYQVVGPEFVPSLQWWWWDSKVKISQFLAGTGVVSIIDKSLMEGRVTDVDGHPIAGVQIAESRGIEPLRPIAVSGADGRFEANFRYWSRQILFLEAHAPGYLPVYWDLQLKPKMDQVEFMLDKALTLKVHVVDIKNQPLANAAVTVAIPATSSKDGFTYKRFNAKGTEAVDVPFTRNYSAYRIQTNTDAQGTFLLTDVPPRSLPVDIQKEGMLSRRGFPLDPMTGEQVIVMYPFFQIRVSVTEAESGLSVTYVTLTPGIAGDGAPGIVQATDAYRWGQREYPTSQRGEYEYTLKEPDISGGPPRPQFVLKCEADGYFRVISPVLEPKASPSTWNAKLKRIPDLTGIVRAVDSPIVEGALFSFSFGAGGPTVQDGQFQFGGNGSTTDATGRYYLRAFRDRPVLFLHEKGWFEASTRTLAASPDVVLIPWAGVKGEYRMGAKPVPNQHVGLRIHHASEFIWRFDATTDTLGRFQFSRVPSGPGVVVWAEVANPRNNSWDPISERIAPEAGETVQIQTPESDAGNR